MIKNVENTQDVIDFAKQIVKEGVSFHCDDDFNDYVNFKPMNKLIASNRQISEIN